MIDGEGLYLSPDPTAPSFAASKYRSTGKEKLLSFGQDPGVVLSDARLRRAEAKIALGQRLAPGARDKPPVVTTFEEAARA